MKKEVHNGRTEKILEFLLGIGIKEFADSIGVSKSLYEKIEYGFREPSRNFITRLKKKNIHNLIRIFFLQELITYREKRKGEG